MDSLVLAVAVAVVVWLFLRRARMTRARRNTQLHAVAEGGQEQPKSMPRFGKPGSVTRQQLAALKKFDFEPSRHWSMDEAQLILDTVIYLRTAIGDVTGQANPPLDIQNKVLGFILTDEELRDYVLDWSRNLTREEEGAPVTFEDTPEHRRIIEFIDGLWED